MGGGVLTSLRSPRGKFAFQVITAFPAWFVRKKFSSRKMFNLEAVALEISPM